MPDFHEIRLPEDISYGSKGGPKFNTTVLPLSSGREKRNINWKNVRCEYDISYGIKEFDQIELLKNFFYARRGKAYGFRFKDWGDYECTNQIIGTGNGVKTAFQLIKTYVSGNDSYTRTISKPVFFENELQQPEFAVGHPNVDISGNPTGGYTFHVIGAAQKAIYTPTIDYTTGVVTFLKDPTTLLNQTAIDAAIAAGTTPPAPITAPLGLNKLLRVTHFEFDVPVRFDTDHLDISQDTWATQSWDQIPLVEVRL